MIPFRGTIVYFSFTAFSVPSSIINFTPIIIIISQSNVSKFFTNFNKKRLETWPEIADTKIKMAENTSRRRSRNVLDYSELNALSSFVLYNTSKRKKTWKKYCNRRSCFASCKHRKQSNPMCTVKIMSSADTHCLRTYCKHWSSLTLIEFLNFSIWRKSKLSDIFNIQKPIRSSGCMKNLVFPRKCDVSDTLFYFVLLLPYISFECLAAILPRNPKKIKGFSVKAKSLRNIATYQKLWGEVPSTILLYHGRGYDFACRSEG